MKLFQSSQCPLTISGDGRQEQLVSGAPISSVATHGDEGREAVVEGGGEGWCCHRDELSSKSLKETTGLFRMFIVFFLIWNSVYAANISIDFP